MRSWKVLIALVSLAVMVGCTNAVRHDDPNVVCHSGMGMEVPVCSKR